MGMEEETINNSSISSLYDEQYQQQYPPSQQYNNDQQYYNDNSGYNNAAAGVGDGWVEARDKKYYYNNYTGKTQWC